MLLRGYQSRHTLPIFFCFSLAVFYFYESLLRIVPSIMLNEIQQAYQLSFLSFGILCASYYFLYIPLQLIIGFVMDRYHLAYLMIVVLLLCAGGCCLFANAYSFELAALGRIFMGIGTAFIFITILKAICLRLPARYFTFYLGIIICVGMLGGFVMDSGLVFFARVWGWRLTCYLLALMGVLFVIWNYSFQICPSRKYGLDKRKLSVKQDILQLKAFLLNRDLLVLSCVGALLYLPIVGFAESWGIGFLKHTNYFSHDIAALQMGMLFLGLAIGAPLIGWLYDRTGVYQLILTVGAIGVTILLSIVLYVPDLSARGLSFFLFLLGFFSSSLIVVLSLTRQMVPPQHVGKAFGIVNASMMLASSATWLIGLLIHTMSQYAIITHLLAISSINGYQLSFVILPCGSLIAVILSYFVNHSR